MKKPTRDQVLIGFWTKATDPTGFASHLENIRKVQNLIWKYDKPELLPCDTLQVLTVSFVTSSILKLSLELNDIADIMQKYRMKKFNVGNGDMRILRELRNIGAHFMSTQIDGVKTAKNASAQEWLEKNFTLGKRETFDSIIAMFERCISYMAKLIQDQIIRDRQMWVAFSVQKPIDDQELEQLYMSVKGQGSKPVPDYTLPS